MFTCKTKNGRIRVKAAGEPNELFADVAILIHSMYENMSPDSRHFFRVSLTRCLSDENSPVWQPHAHRDPPRFSFFGRGRK